MCCHSRQMVERLAEEDLAKYREIFSYFDRDGGGSIGAEELAQVSSWVGGAGAR